MDLSVYGLLFTIFVTPGIILIYIKNTGKFSPLLRKDANKPEAHSVLTSTGIFMLPGMVYTLVFLLGELGLAISLGIFLAGVLGFIDDLKSVGVWTKIPLMCIPSIPVLAYCTLNGYSPLIFSILPVIYILPLVTSFFSNAFNIVSGYDGMSMGTGIIQIGTLSVLAFLSQDYTLFTSSVLLMLIIGFVFHVNWYPAKAFPGNSGTFLVGTLIALLYCFSGFWIPLIILFAPHIAEFVMKIRFRGNTNVFGRVDALGNISYNGKPKSIIHFILRNRTLKEYQITQIMLICESVLGLLSILVYLFME